jgi:hypothetical protein
MDPQGRRQTVTRNLDPDQVDRYQPWFDNARRLRQLVTELHQIAVEQADNDAAG